MSLKTRTWKGMGKMAGCEPPQESRQVVPTNTLLCLAWVNLGVNVWCECDVSQPQDLSKHFQKPTRNISEVGLAGSGSGGAGREACAWYTWVAVTQNLNFSPGSDLSMFSCLSKKIKGMCLLRNENTGNIQTEESRNSSLRGREM